MQYNEFYHKKTGLTIGVEEVLFSEQSDFQKVEVLKTDTWGNLMTIDDMVMLSEKDEFVYHEMLAHVPMNAHPKPEMVLIIGGGDGGTAREVLKHASVQQVDLVEIDETVVRAAKAHMPQIGDWDNPKLNVLFEDGIEHVKAHSDTYDVIIVDGSDPVGPAEVLFTQDFYTHCFYALKVDGVLSTQTESPWVQSYHESMKNVFQILKNTFDESSMYICSIPLYPAGLWSMGYASKGVNPLEGSVMQCAKAFSESHPDLKYYNESVHQASFALPNFVRDIIQ